ncbi:unnamed protein product [Withania somnifera]
MATKLLVTLAICRLIVTVGFTFNPNDLFRLGFDGKLSIAPADLESASVDFGGLHRAEPIAVLYPATPEDVARLVKAAYDSASGFTVSARGHGHSINGQAMTTNGVVIQMSGGSTNKMLTKVSEKFMYADVSGGELWIDVLTSTLEYGLAPKSWTDYLYLTVGGTLSNAGISGQAFHHGPQISNVHELDVVTGKGELLTCSEKENSELFQAVLGGLGQFGIITRARIALEQAPQRVFFFSPRNPVKISSLKAEGGVLYCLEITKNYHLSNADTIDQEIEILMKKLNYIPASVFTTDLPYVDFLDRVHKAELKLRSKGLWDVPHPWLNLFIPKSRIAEFDKGVFKGILGNKTSGPILIYPVNKNKWDERSSVVTPEEDIFYLVAFLRSALQNGDRTQTLDYLSNQNYEILKFCEEARINVKQYLPHYTNQREWRDHFGEKYWIRFQQRKLEFDPRHILATGQRIFTPTFNPNTASW